MARKYRHFVYDENQRFIYPTSDWGFKYLLGSEANKYILLGILQKLLPELGIESLEFLPRDFAIPIGKMKDGSFDVHCKLSDGSRAIIEMQNYARQTFLDRAVVYTSAAVLESFVNSRAKGYRIGKTIFIAFVGDPLFKDVNRTPVRIALCDIDEKETTPRSDKVLQIFVEMPKFAGSITEIDEHTPFVEKLAYVLMEMADCSEMPANLGDPLLESLFRAADTQTMDDGMKDNYFKSIIGECDYESGLEDAREAGLEIGVEQGIEQGIQQGREEGIALERKAAEERMRQTALKLKSQGLSVEAIADATGLSVKETSNL